ncbi:uncharacterized protein LOC120443412 [Oreochromis aureus]|uniref:uncharacterized protein LOC120443412 n=1 Tax=Oreochromis aureus TaxID=47969 RepID=UPI001954AB19|nr:uncharacterized protein LOC120443412 [Oreochromis aureus]
MDSIRYENCYAASEVSKQMVPSDWRNVEWTNKMKVYLNSDQAVTAKDLLSMFSPFGCVISVQTTVKNNHRYGMVHYHSADEAAVALREMKRSTKVFFVAQVGIREVGEGRKDKRSERPDRPPPGSCSYRPLYRRPILWEPLFPAYRRTVSIEIDNLPRSWYERELLLSLLPPTTIDVKVFKRKACVVLLDFSSALRLRDLLNNAFKHLRFMFSPHGRRRPPDLRPFIRKKTSAAGTVLCSR